MTNNNSIKVRKGALNAGDAVKGHFNRNNHKTTAGSRLENSTRTHVNQSRVAASVESTKGDGKTIHKIRIDENFVSTTIAGWKIWVNHKGRIICSPINRNDTVRHFRTFAFEVGTMHIEEDSVRNTSTIFFRTDEFQDFILKYGITKVMSKAPSGRYNITYYTGEGENFKPVQNYLITDGCVSMAVSDKSEELPIINMTNANRYYDVSGASILVLDTYAINYSGDTFHVRRTLVTKLDLKEAASELDSLLKDVCS